MIDFWESSQKQKKLKSYIVAHLLKNLSFGYSKNKDIDREDLATYNAIGEKSIFSKRNEIAQKIIELAYHIYGKR
ncbi:MAG TPA: hypothetical protein HPP56_04205 [Nitrospirae bacterium]|nr:hypothetical protein [Nitrospirota bacterium]